MRSFLTVNDHHDSFACQSEGLLRAVFVASANDNYDAVVGSVIEAL